MQTEHVNPDPHDQRIGFESTTSRDNLTGEPKNYTDRPWPEKLEGDKVPDDGIKRLDFMGQSIPGIAWLPLDNEIDERMKDKLIQALIDYCEKLGGGTRFKSAAQAYSYFAIRNDKQLDRINELSRKLKEIEDSKEEPQAVISDANLGISPNTTPSRFIYKDGKIPGVVKMDHEGNVTVQDQKEREKDMAPLGEGGREPSGGTSENLKPSTGGIPAPPSGGS